jgi:class 3 adenylate cyclase/tetratricopeptide (TPR) repeat protein
MFCDLVDSTALSTQADPEDYRDFIARYRTVLEEVIKPHHGYVAHYMGDGVLVYFGYPTSSGQDAENAVEAALAIVRHVASMEPFAGQPPRVRIGVASGLTIVGATDRMREMQGDSAVGETPNLAARLQGLATANAIVISASTRALLGELYDCRDLGAAELKGFDQPVRAWQVLGRGAGTDRFLASRTGRPDAGFVGRSAELAQLRHRLATARAGRGQVAIVAGEAGLGKSRLARQILEEAGTDRRVPILQCTSYNVGTPFHPLRYQIERLAGLETQDAPDVASGKLAALLDRVGLSTPERLALLAELTHVAGADLAALHGLGSPERRNRTMRLLHELMEAALRDAAVVIVEDIQWIDPSTAELIERLLPTIGALPVLLICTMRPGPFPAWLAAAEARLIQLDRLPHDEATALVRTIADKAELPGSVVEAIAARSDGIPIFAEELTRGYLETAAAGGQGDDGLSSIPATLTESLLARLDRLKQGRRVASIAAAIAREFPIAVLVAVSGLPEAEVRAGIAELLDADLLMIGHSRFGEAVAFRHMLVRDAAYQLLLRRERTALHARIAETLKVKFPHIAEALPHVVALQLADAGDVAGSAVEWDRAGSQAARRSAYSEAIGHFTKALETNERGPPSRPRDERELACRLNLIGALIAARGFAAEGVAAEMERALALSHRLGSTAQLIPVLTSKWVVVGSGGDYRASLEIARQIHHAAQSGSTVDRLLGYRVLGTSLLFGGQFAQALEAFENFLAVYDRDRDEAELRKVGPSSHALMAMLGIAEVYTLFDEPEAADRWRQKVLEGARLDGGSHNICNAIMFCGCFLPALTRQYDQLAERAAELKELCRVHNLPYWRGHADLFTGLALIRQGHVDEGFVEARRGVKALVAASAFMNGTFILYAEACLDSGRDSEAELILDRALPAIEHGENWLVAEYHRMRGRLAAQRRQEAEARTSFETAIRVAESQGARLFAGRARHELASLTASARRQPAS